MILRHNNILIKRIREAVTKSMDFGLIYRWN